MIPPADRTIAMLHPAEPHEFASLDALRGLAILMVIVAHFGGGLTGQDISIFLANAGVILFFFLSGFLIDRALALDGNLFAYAIRRAFRILPMSWLSLVLVAAWAGSHWTVGQLLANATFTAPVFKSERMLGVYWTLYIEVLFYCIAPLLSRAGDRAIHLSSYVALLGFALVLLFRDVGSGAPFYAFFCLCGMQIGAWYRGKLGPYQLAASIAAISIGASLLLPVSIYLGLVPLACAALLVAGLQYPVGFRPLEFLGTISYSWYLLHSIFAASFVSLPIPEWTALTLAAALTLALSVVTYIGIERPAILTGKTIIKKIIRKMPDGILRVRPTPPA